MGGATGAQSLGGVLVVVVVGLVVVVVTGIGGSGSDPAVVLETGTAVVLETGATGYAEVVCSETPIPEQDIINAKVTVKALSERFMIGTPLS